VNTTYVCLIHRKNSFDELYNLDIVYKIKQFTHNFEMYLNMFSAILLDIELRKEKPIITTKEIKIIVKIIPGKILLSFTSD
jgi:hypothetical protein